MDDDRKMEQTYALEEARKEKKRTWIVGSLGILCGAAGNEAALKWFGNGWISDILTLGIGVGLFYLLLKSFEL